MSCPDCKSPIINQTPTLIGSPVCLPDCPPNVGCADMIASPCVVYTGPNLVCTGLNQNSTLTDLYTAVELLCANQYAQANPLVSVVKVSLTSAEILTLNTTPIQVIPNPGIGNFINVLSITGNFIYNTTDYTTNTVMEFYFPTTTGILANNGIIASSGSTMEHFGVGGGVIASNQPLMVTIQTGDPVGGDGTIDLYITYTISIL